MNSVHATRNRKANAMNDLVPFDRDDTGELLAAGAIVSSFPAGDRVSRLQVYRSVQGTDRALDDIEGEEIAIANVVIHAVRVASKETGEMMDAIRTVLVSPEGTRYSTLSPYPAQCLRQWYSVSGELPPYNPPLRAIVRKVKRRAGDGRYLQLEVCP